MHVVEAMLICVNASLILQQLLYHSVPSFGAKAIKPKALFYSFGVSNSQDLINTFLAYNCEYFLTHQFKHMF